jgi:hypothetical protein
MAFRHSAKETDVWRWVIAGLVVVLVAVGVTAAVNWDDDWDRHDEGVTRIVAEDGTETIVVREGRPGFFPFGIFLFPLLLFFAFMAVRAFAWRGNGGGNGPWMRSGAPTGEPPSWFQEWHRRTHEGGTTTPTENRPPDAGTP